MSKDIKRMNIKEFRELGYLMELNRTFLHPLGLALEVVIDEETGEERLGGIWDYRDDPEGMNFGWEDEQAQQRARVKAAFVEAQRQAKKQTREEALGYFIQPV